VEVCITQPILGDAAIFGPEILVTVEDMRDDGAALVIVDVSGPAILTHTVPGPNTFIPPVIQITTDGR
jgi:hypothetical protein